MLRRTGHRRPSTLILLVVLSATSAAILSTAAAPNSYQHRVEFEYQDCRCQLDEVTGLSCFTDDRLPHNSWLDWYAYFLKRNVRLVESWIEKVLLTI
jgi:hypothetical protein